MTALYETASDLTAIRDVDTILAAIVRRARQLLGADMAYLSLNDEADGASYMKVTDGALTAEFRSLRLPLGTGLLGLVAQTGAPYYTEDYQADERFVHRDYIDSAVAGEQIRAILGVPLVVDGTVIGALLAVHRTVRPFPPGEVSLLMSFAAHAALALENARLFARTQEALAEVDAANRQIRAHSEAMELAAHAHDELTDVLLKGGGVAEVAAVLADVLQGDVAVYDDAQRELAVVGAGEWGLDEDSLVAAVERARQSGRSVEVDRAPDAAPDGAPAYVATALGGAEHLGTLLLSGRRAPLGQAERRTLERGALVTALVLLFNRSVAEAEERVRGELLTDLLAAGGADTIRLRERARLQRADIESPGVVAVAAVEDGERRRAVVAGVRLASELEGLAGEHAGHLVLVAPGQDPLAIGRLLLQRVGAAGCTGTVGVATAPGGPDGLAGGVRGGAALSRHSAHPRPLRRRERPRRARRGPAAAGAERSGRARGVRAAEPGAGARVRRPPRHRSRGHARGLVRRRRAPGRGRTAAARAPEHRRPAAGAARTAARRRLAGARSGARPAARAAAVATQEWACATLIASVCGRLAHGPAGRCPRSVRRHE